MKRFNPNRTSVPNLLHTRGRVGHKRMCHTRALVLLSAVVAMIITVACSNGSKPVTKVEQPISVQPAPASSNSGQMTATVQPTSAKGDQMWGTVAMRKTSAPVKAAAAKPIVYRSRDYGVSFVYPWQYTFVSARKIANGDPALRPKSDGQEGQLTLARVEVPKGFYPDTNFDRGYFTLSLNQELSEEQCLATVNEGKVETENVNGVDFRWVESDSGGRGSAAKVRNYAAFTNGTCYELEIGVRTSNRDGLAREVDPDQVLQRLHGILQTVEIAPSVQNAPKVASATAETE